MSLSLSSDVAEQFSDFEESKDSLSGLEKKLSELTSLRTAESGTEDALEAAQIHLVYAQSINVLFHFFLRTRGIDPFKHALHKEHDRIKQYEKKINKATAENELRRLRPKATLNIAAANRFIDHAIPDLTPAQRAQLKQASIAHTEAPPSDGRGSTPSRKGRRGSQQQQVQNKKPRQGSVSDAAVAFLQQVRADAAKQ